MDGNGGRRLKSKARWRRYTDISSLGRPVLAYLKTHKQLLFSGVLLLMAIGLLFGLASKLQAPITNAPPNGVTVISYSTFLEQVQAGNVQAVTLQGKDINGFLNTPLLHHQPAMTTAARTSASNNAADFAAWSRFVGAGYSSWPNSTASPPVDPARAVFTHLPGSGDANLMPMLLSNKVIVNTPPVAQPPMWI